MTIDEKEDLMIILNWLKGLENSKKLKEMDTKVDILNMSEVLRMIKFDYDWVMVDIITGRDMKLKEIPFEEIMKSVIKLDFSKNINMINVLKESEAFSDLLKNKSYMEEVIKLERLPNIINNFLINYDYVDVELIQEKKNRISSMLKKYIKEEKYEECEKLQKKLNSL